MWLHVMAMEEGHFRVVGWKNGDGCVFEKAEEEEVTADCIDLVGPSAANLPQQDHLTTRYAF